MFLGAVCEREVLVAPRARGLFVARAVYAGTLLGIIATCWLLVSGTRPITTVGDTARFGGTLLRILGPLQLALAMMSAALTSVVAVGVEKDRKTLELLLVSRLDDAQLVLGKLAGSLLRTALLLVAAVPVFALFAIVAWLATGEVVAAVYGGDAAAAISPVRGLFASLSPAGSSILAPLLGSCGAIAVIATVWAIARARAWNTRIQVRPRFEDEAGGAAAGASWADAGASAPSTPSATARQLGAAALTRCRSP